MPTDPSGPIWNKRLRVVDFSHAKSDSPVDRMKNTVNRELTEMKFRNQWFSDFTNSWINTKFLIFKGFIEHHFCVESNVSKWCSLSNMAHKNEDNTLSTLPCNFMRFLVTKGSKNENWKILLWYNPEECEFSRFKIVLKT